MLAAFGDRGDSRLHGRHHALEVAVAGARILGAGCDADPAVVLAFAILHDSQRENEGRDPEHGERAARAAERFSGDLLRLDDNQMLALEFSLVDHDRGMVTDEVTMGACWDSDRLTLPRVGITPSPRRLSTPEGRSLIGVWSPREAVSADWGWVSLSYGVIGS